MTALFIPVRKSFSVAVAAGAALATQVTYTPAAGKRAVLEHVHLSVSAAAGATANTGICRCRVSVDATDGVGTVAYVRSAGAALDEKLSYQPNMVLRDTATTIIETAGVTGAAVTMTGTMTFREYQ